MVQMNIPQGFLDPVADNKPQTSEEELAEEVKRTVLLSHIGVLETQTEKQTNQNTGCCHLAEIEKKIL